MTQPDKLHNNQVEPRRLDEFDNAPVVSALLVEPDPQNPGKTRPRAAGEGGGGGSAAAPTETYPPEILNVTDQPAQLDPPEGANCALVMVTGPDAVSVRMGLQSATGATAYGVGSGVEVRGAQLAALRLLRAGATNAAVRADYWREE